MSSEDAEEQEGKEAGEAEDDGVVEWRGRKEREREEEEDKNEGSTDRSDF